ncbi:hypothetical protein DJ82_12725 [Halorubrum sp. Ib24]|uniref:DUF6541 family protein n=1 Tax=Halorubrum sp. Ib24 TaxID=1383850 RepID=UPI000B99296C|nr:DUF6541 family protein [Halorubrum sp. Ib24]OYR38133.1 hypothetical protein DJ82_12725 [Halorubrum sp. Ib24]
MSPDLSKAPEDRSAVSVALLIGSACFFAAVTVAEANPAAGYEVSIYRSTPLIFWIGIAVSLLTGIGALALGTSLIQWAEGIVLTGLSMLSVPALPLIRGYFFYGLGDGLRHLGRARGLVTGEVEFFDTVYPGAYSFSGFLSVFSGISLEQSMLFVAFAASALYVVFVVLCVRTILPGRRAVAIATLSALMFLPINHISFHPHFHTFSMATFLTPILLYVVIKHITDRGADETIPRRLSSTDLGFAVTALAIVLYHPQVALNVIIVLGAIAVIQKLNGRLIADNALSSSPPVYGQLLFLVVFFALWNFQHDAVFRMSSFLFSSVNGWLLGTEQAGQIVTQRTESANTVGLGIGELFVKLFLVPAFYALVAGAVVVTNLLSDQFDEKSRIITTTFSLAGVGLGIYSLAHFVGEVSGYFFRHIGFGMVLVTILAGIGLTKAGAHVDELHSSPSRAVKMITVIGLVTMLVLSVLMVFPSPYLNQPSQHVSEQTYLGHETAMEYRADGAALASPRSDPRRYSTAMGLDVAWGLGWAVPPDALPSDLRRFRGNNFPTREFYYYIQTDQDKQEELIAYGGIRYEESDFTGVDETVGVSQIITNGETEVYHVKYDEQTVENPQIRSPELSSDQATKPPQRGVNA